MSATVQHPTTTVTLTAAQRDVILEEVEFALDSAGDLAAMRADGAANVCDRIYVRELAWRLGVAVRLLDQLGWDHAEERGAYVLELDADIDRFVGRIERYALAALGDNRDALINGDHDARTNARELIDVDLDALEAARLVRTAFRGGQA